MDEWRRSAVDAAIMAESTWIRMAADMHSGGYQTFQAVAELGAPEWPKEPWGEILAVGLRDRRIESEDHAVIRQLLGEA